MTSTTDGSTLISVQVEHAFDHCRGSEEEQFFNCELMQVDLRQHASISSPPTAIARMQLVIKF